MDQTPPPAAPSIQPPTAFPDAGVYGVTQLVTLLCETPGATIHYTTDGALPTAASARFDPYQLIPTADLSNPEGRSAHTLRAFAAADGHSSPVATFTYQIERRGRGEYVSHDVAPGVRMIRDFDDDKLFLVVGSQKALLVDAGLGAGDLRGYVESFTAGRPLEVVITHAHPDHVACLAQFQSDFDVYMNLTDLPLIRNFNQRFHYGIDPDRIQDLREECVFDLGDRQLKVYEVPGHSAGSIVLLDEASGDLIAGDAVGSNRPTIVDAMWMQMPGMSLIDDYLSSLQVFRAKTAGKVKSIYTGHNDCPLKGDVYLDRLEEALQSLVDRGVDALVPSLRPSGIWQVFSGDRLTDPDWAAINVNRDHCLTANPDQIATLSNLQVNGAVINERFDPHRLAYTARAEQSVDRVEIVPVTTSSRCQALTINGVAAAPRRPLAVDLVTGKNLFHITVTSPAGTTRQMYTLQITRG